MKASEQTKRARAGAERPEHSGMDELLELVTRLRRAVDAGSRGTQARPRPRYADRSEDADATPARPRPTTGVWGR